MRTLDAKILKKKKENLHAEFEKVKARGGMFEKQISDAQEELGKCYAELAKLEGKYDQLTDLEKELGIEPTLPDLNKSNGTANLQSKKRG